MSRGVNRVTLLGNLGADPETRQMPNGKAVTNLRIATSERWKDKQTGEDREQTEWHSVVLYDRLAEIAAEYLKKGSQAYLEGKLRTRKWQDKEGRDRYSTEIIANELQLVGRAPGGESYAPTAAQRDQVERSASTPARPAAAAPAGDLNDDIPF